MASSSRLRLEPSLRTSPAPCTAFDWPQVSRASSNCRFGVGDERSAWCACSSSRSVLVVSTYESHAQTRTLALQGSRSGSRASWRCPTPRALRVFRLWGGKVEVGCGPNSTRNFHGWASGSDWASGDERASAVRAYPWCAACVCHGQAAGATDGRNQPCAQGPGALGGQYGGARVYIPDVFRL